jgi:hypothetical protein
VAKRLAGEFEFDGSATVDADPVERDGSRSTVDGDGSDAEDFDGVSVGVSVGELGGESVGESSAVDGTRSCHCRWMISAACCPWYARIRPGASRMSRSRSKFRTLQMRLNLKYKPIIISDDR